MKRKRRPIQGEEEEEAHPDADEEVQPTKKKTKKAVMKMSTRHSENVQDLGLTSASEEEEVQHIKKRPKKTTTPKTSKKDTDTPSKDKTKKDTHTPSKSKSGGSATLDDSGTSNSTPSKPNSTASDPFKGSYDYSVFLGPEYTPDGAPEGENKHPSTRSASSSSSSKSSSSKSGK